MAGTGSETAGPVRYFSGDAEDGKEYKQWKVWCQNKLLTLDKLSEANRGPYIYTLLSGKALETVEHLEPEAYQKAGGDKVLWDLLDQRFPQKEQVDELGEILGEVFSMKIREGESVKAWTARSQELFDRCKRKTNVDFPDQARGWLTLNRASLSEEQRAVVIARARGSLSRESISIAMRSCYPDLLGPRKKAVAAVDEVLPVEHQTEIDDAWEDEFRDVVDFVEDNAHGDEEIDEHFAESDVAEVLASTWKEKRMELSKLQRARQFGEAKEVRRAFRVEVEEMKARTSCNRCGKKGHWARECPMPKGSAKGKGSSSASTTSGAAAVVSEDAGFDFVAQVSSVPRLLDLVRSFKSSSPCFDVALVSCPGFGVIDSGCGRTMVGEATLSAFEKLWKQRGLDSPPRLDETHQFKFGNGHLETSKIVVPMPVKIAGKTGVIRASIVKGHAPLLISRTALKSLGASLDFKNDRLRMLDSDIQLQVNQAGQYVIDLLDSEAVDSSPPAEALVVNVTVPEGEAQDPTFADTTPDDASTSSSEDVPQASVRRIWSQEDSGTSLAPLLSHDGPQWKHVVRRIVPLVTNNKVLSDVRLRPGISQSKTIEPFGIRDAHVITEFHHVDPRSGDLTVSEELPGASKTWRPTAKQARQLQPQLELCHEVHASEWKPPKDRFHVMEVFSPPRFTPVVRSQGLGAMSYDKLDGCNLDNP